MPRVNRLSGFSIATAMLLALSTSLSFGQSAPDDAAKKRVARELAEAVHACDKGATAPLDDTARMPPVQYFELFPADFDTSRLKDLQAKCQAAWIGAPTEKRLHLQWIRVTVALGDANVQLLTPQVRALADAGNPEAQYLLYRLQAYNEHAVESSMMQVSRAEGWTNLLKAAEAGHMEAIGEVILHYRGGRYVSRDLKQVTKWLRRLEGAPPQGIESTAYEMKARARAPIEIAWTMLEEDGFSATENRAAFRLVEADMKSGSDSAAWSARTVVKCLRTGRGTSKDPARARGILEARSKDDRQMVPVLADMLVRGEGGPEDGRRALEMVRAPEFENDSAAMSVLAEILLAGKVVGHRPREAIQALSRSYESKDAIRLAGLLIDYETRIERPERLIGVLDDAGRNGDAEAILALARLKLSGLTPFSDDTGARALLKPLADAGNREALWLYASTQYSHLGSSSYRPARREDGLSDAELMATVDEGIRREEPEAFLLKAKLLRAGILYPQDDRGASDMLKQAAERDNVEALLLLGDAYDDGLGISKDKKRRLEAWRRAATLGSLKARSKISRAFTFDTFDRLMTLEEGVTWRIALYNNGYGRSFDGMGAGAADIGAQMDLDVFSGRAMEAGTDAVAEAIMNGFREAPAGLEDNNLVTMGKAFPKEIKVAIERRLAREGFLRGAAGGYWGPEARKALADWVEAKGYDTASTEISVVAEEKPAPVQAGELISKDSIGRKWDRIRSEFQAAKTDKQKRAALAKVNMLAQYGNIDARWALLPNYHQAALVRRVVSAAEITRYGLDLMLTKPPGAEKIEFEFIFNTTQIYQDGKAREFGQSVIAAIRDDKRLQDPLALGGVLKQLIFAPGACDAVLAAAKRAGIDGLGEDGCDETTLAALVAFAKAKGPAGIDERNRKAAAEALKDI